jgi:hypothetical protein
MPMERMEAKQQAKADLQIGIEGRRIAMYE